MWVIMRKSQTYRDNTRRVEEEGQEGEEGEICVCHYCLLTKGNRTLNMLFQLLVRGDLSLQ